MYRVAQKEVERIYFTLCKYLFGCGFIGVDNHVGSSEDKELILFAILQFC